MSGDDESLELKLARQAYAEAETARRFAEHGEKLRQLTEQVAEQNKKLAESGK